MSRLRSLIASGLALGLMPLGAQAPAAQAPPPQAPAPASMPPAPAVPEARPSAVASGAQAPKVQSPFVAIPISRDTRLLQEDSLPLTAGGAAPSLSQMSGRGSRDTSDGVIATSLHTDMYAPLSRMEDRAEDVPIAMRRYAIPVDPGEKVILSLKAQDTEKMYMRLGVSSKTDPLVHQVRRANSTSLALRRKRIEITNDTKEARSFTLVLLGMANVSYCVELERIPKK